MKTAKIKRSKGQGNAAGSVRETIPMSSPDITNLEREAVAAVMQTPYLSMGPEVEAFEIAIARYVGVEHALSLIHI